MVNPTPAAIKLARLNLSAFVQREARRTAEELGFGWRPAQVTPSGLEGLRAELRSCHQTGLPFRVLEDFSEDTIFMGKATNWAFRFVHDTRHVWLNADFSTEAELEVASCHLARAKADGLETGTLEYAFLFADTVGQTLYVEHTHRFVVHQRQFVLDCVRLGLDQAIERESASVYFDGTAS